jgi:aprataxin
MSRLDTLRTYATLPKPTSSLPPTTLLTSNPHAIAIFDAYPKAKYHFLILPRYPFPARDDPEDNHRSIVKINEIDDLRGLLTKTSGDVREQVIAGLADMAREVEEMIRDEMVKTEGFEWGIDIGFHAIPSMK